MTEQVSTQERCPSCGGTWAIFTRNCPDSFHNVEPVPAGVLSGDESVGTDHLQRAGAGSTSPEPSNEADEAILRRILARTEEGVFAVAALDRLRQRLTDAEAHTKNLVREVQRLERSRHDLHERNRMLTEHDDCNWRHKVKSLQTAIDRMVAANAQDTFAVDPQWSLRAENTAMREALRWYADKDDINNYVAVAILAQDEGSGDF